MKYLSITIILIALVVCAEQAIANASDLYYPEIASRWETVSPRNAGFDPQKLEKVTKYAKKQKSSGVIILYQGRMVTEQYWDTTPKGWENTHYKNLLIEMTSDGRAIEDVASIQKSIISFLAGVARGKGKLDIERPVSGYLGTGWSKAALSQESHITVRHLMSMTSGLSITLDFQTPAGSEWKYNTRAYSKMIQVLESATGMTISQLTADWLTRPTGMVESRWVLRHWRQDHHDANTIGFAGSARDLAKFGLLVMANGTWMGHPILEDPGFLQEALRPSQDLNHNYGLLWWLNSEKMYPDLPKDTVIALGAFSRIVAVIRSHGIVAVRIGNQAETGFVRTFTRLVYDTVLK